MQGIIFLFLVVLYQLQSHYMPQDTKNQVGLRGNIKHLVHHYHRFSHLGSLNKLLFWNLIC